MRHGTVAIVGRPNVGKSSLFNRLAGDKLAITDDASGITRDRLYAKCEWLDQQFAIIDTGGIELSDVPFMFEIRAQAELAIDEADVIVFNPPYFIFPFLLSQYFSKISHNKFTFLF